MPGRTASGLCPGSARLPWLYPISTLRRIGPATPSAHDGRGGGPPSDGRDAVTSPPRTGEVPVAHTMSPHRLAAIDPSDRTTALVLRIGAAALVIGLLAFGLLYYTDQHVASVPSILERQIALFLEEANKKDFQTDLALFRILQEALTNVIRHARATKVVVSIVYEQNGTHMTIADDGIGIVPEILESSNSMGLFGMKERARQCNGTLEMGLNHPCGTKITVFVPVKKLVTN